MKFVHAPRVAEGEDCRRYRRRRNWGESRGEGGGEGGGVGKVLVCGGTLADEHPIH